MIFFALVDLLLSESNTRELIHGVGFIEIYMLFSIKSGKSNQYSNMMLTRASTSTRRGRP